MPLKVTLVQIVNLSKRLHLHWQKYGADIPTENSAEWKALFKELILNSESSPHTPYPLGILSLAAYARKQLSGKISLNIIDMAESMFDEDLAVHAIMKDDPDVVGFSCCSAYSETLHKIVHDIKKLNDNLKIICGGPYPSASTERAISDPNIDCAVYGEGEITFVEILDNIICGKTLDNILGTAYNKNKKIVINKPRPLISNIDELPFPAVDLIDIKKYWSGGNPLGQKRPHTILFNSRGCPFNCIYCHSIFGKKPIFMSPDRTFNEIKFYHDTYGIEDFSVWDDVFNLDIPRAEELFRKIIASKIDIRLFFMGGFRADIMKTELLTPLIKAGGCLIVYPIESGSTRIQHLIRKKLDLKKAQETINETAKRGIWVNINNMLGFPTETLAEMKRTVEFSLKLKGHSISFYKAIPHEGTEMFKMFNTHNKTNIKNESEMYYSYCNNKRDHKVDDLVTDAELRFYTDPERLEGILRIKSDVLSKTEFKSSYTKLLLSAMQKAGLDDTGGLSSEQNRLLDILFRDNN
jgi:anaerobic magnesium-protoporphyrin IX monomethyl ester cyclase